MTKIVRCPNPDCNKSGPFNSFKLLNSGINVDNLGHFHVMCECGRQFNVWDNDKKAQETFDINYNIYK